MNWIKSKWFSGLVFSLLFAGLCWYFNYNDTFFQSPQSVHIWRQTNSLSMTQMYYQYNVPFFQPEIQSQVCDQGTSGKTVGEFPIIYYAMAKVWKIFGKSVCQKTKILRTLDIGGILFSGHIIKNNNCYQFYCSWCLDFTRNIIYEIRKTDFQLQDKALYPIHYNHIT